jgi:homoserine kinase
MKAVAVSVPATTANLGPGFDCLALALGLHNTLEMQPAAKGWTLEIEGEGAHRLAKGPANLIAQAASRVFDLVARRPAGLRLRAVNRIPLGSGLGSSAAATLAGLSAANAMVDGGLSPTDILHLASEFEGHADNAAAALFGGLNIVGPSPEGLVTRRVPVAELQIAVVIPELELPTTRMRQALPDTVPLSDAAFNTGRTALTVEALRAGDYDLMAQAMDDRLHQPHRAPFIPGYQAVVEAALGRGAAAVTLSGAGPSLVAFAPTGQEAIAQAMVEAFEASGVKARGLVLPVAHAGLRIRHMD